MQVDIANWKLHWRIKLLVIVCFNSPSIIKEVLWFFLFFFTHPYHALQFFGYLFMLLLVRYVLESHISGLFSRGLQLDG